MNRQDIIEWKDFPTLRELRGAIDNLDISADAKATLMRIGETTAEVGGKLIAIGRRILAFALNLVRQFPNIAFCVIIALIISALVTSVPLIGSLLGVFVTPLLVAAGVGGGALLEIADGDLRERINLLMTEFGQIFA